MPTLPKNFRPVTRNTLFFIWSYQLWHIAMRASTLWLEALSEVLGNQGSPGKAHLSLSALALCGR